MKIISLDQASACTGVAVFINNNLDKYDLIDLKKRENTVERFQEMILSIHTYIINENPDYVVFEDVSLQTNVSTLLLLAQIQGAIMQTCVSNKIPYKLYKPTSWRRILCHKQGKGIKRPELKAQSKQYVKDKYGLVLKDDLTDAICIGDAFIKENERNT